MNWEMPGSSAAWAGNELDHCRIMLRADKHILQFAALELMFGHHLVDELGDAGKFGSLGGKRAQQQQGQEESHSGHILTRQAGAPLLNFAHPHKFEMKAG